MKLPQPEDYYPRSPDYQQLHPLRIPGGWQVAINKLRVGMDAHRSAIGGSSQFHATNAGSRFNIDVEFVPEFDPSGSFYLTVLYEPWPRTQRGRRRKDLPFALTADAERVHHVEISMLPALIAELEHWIARCTVWVREGN